MAPVPFIVGLGRSRWVPGKPRRPASELGGMFVVEDLGRALDEAANLGRVAMPFLELFGCPEARFLQQVLIPKVVRIGRL